MNQAIETDVRMLDGPTGSAEAYFYLGNALQAERRLEESVTAYRQSLAICPGAVSALNNMAAALRLLNRFEEAIEAYQRALVIEPNSASLHSNLGGALHQQGRFAESVAELRHALSLQPDLAEAKGSLGIALLQQGDFAEGWPLYESRFVLKQYSKTILPGPWWNGEPLEGKRILLRAEQGFGDTIQFIRYAPMLAARGAEVILAVPAELRRLIQGQCGVGQMVCKGEMLPRYDVQCRLLSLPRLFGTRLETIPATIPYLRADPEMTGRWATRLSEHSGSFKVGLVWAGGPVHTNDHNRSLPLREFAPLASARGVCLYSLQKGAPAAQAHSLPEGIALTDWSGELADFADTAAFVSALDLVISVDTAVAHLAGALGKRIWLLVPYVSDWRWLLGRSDSPWYPSMRIFRQESLGDWRPPLAQVAHQLTILTRSD